MPSNGPSRDEYEEFQAEYTEVRFMQMRWASKAAKVIARYENCGGDADDLREGYRLGTMDRDQARARIALVNRIARWSGIVTTDTNGQGSFATTFDTSAPDAGEVASGSRLSVARAHMDGWNTGAKGRKPSLDDNPFGHAPGSQEFVAWVEGFNAGMEDRKPEKVRTDDDTDQGGEADAESTADPAPEEKPKRRGRKARAADAAPPPPSDDMPEPPAPIH